MNSFELYLKQNSVDNIIRPNSKYLFVLESPHTDELDENCPISGLAGKEISKHINCGDEAFGQKVRKNKELLISIINVCSAPLQKTKSQKTNEI